ncbi:ParB/Srx family N-terminal domain-containing protein [Cupriavidus sp. WKF15]|uniref:ParB/Srx family N-terminal domain-containing protein n=1 Tax=Cupriavidus sp. WKF15 TaxID=3032282 RepID=UPI0023E0C98D|nr:ParB/Srx family N-terminal domain-containing protein [Cupriavidus sp. WKF15]WER48655.1 ParB/Srx family N-terminal domain-containing protein [Cupriavidus sp. WKF15]
MARRGKAIAELARLRPTQLTLGYIHMRDKMAVTRRQQDAGGAALRRFLRRHRIKTVAGPGGTLFIVDHHHWARAWSELGYRRAPVRILHDLGGLGPSAFWKRLDALGYVHPYNELGDRLGVAALPASVMGMRDDPYRSLAAFTRMAGAYRKPPNAAGDFRWAGFLREHVEEDMGTIGGFALALSLAIRLARSSAARRLPGYCGPAAA